PKAYAVTTSPAWAGESAVTRLPESGWMKMVAPPLSVKRNGARPETRIATEQPRYGDRSRTLSVIAVPGDTSNGTWNQISVGETQTSGNGVPFISTWTPAISVGKGADAVCMEPARADPSSAKREPGASNGTSPTNVMCGEQVGVVGITSRTAPVGTS